MDAWWVNMNESMISQIAEPVGEPQQHYANASKRILVVDDDEDIRRLNTEVLSCSGYEVDAAEDGSVAWDALQSSSYDLLVTDNGMPKVSGLELLKRLRSARMALPVIMATGKLPQEEFALHPWLHPEATLLKPYTVAELLGKVREILNSSDRANGQSHSPGA